MTSETSQSETSQSETSQINTRLEEDTIKNIIDNYDEQIKYYQHKSNILETAKNVASRKNVYTLDNYLFVKNINYYVTILLWTIAIIYMYLKFIHKKQVTKKTIAIIFAITLTLYLLHYISIKINTLYTNYLLSNAKQYKHLEYKIIEGKEI